MTLETLLLAADDEAFFRMVWAIDALQTGREEAAARYLRFPAEAVNTDIASKFAIHEWDLETLIGQLLITPRPTYSDGILDCTQFAAAAEAVNSLRELEDAEAEFYLKRLNIRDELHRIGHRQFAWQRGYFNRPQLYRYAYIYGQGDCADYFQRTYGLTMNEYSLIGFALYTALERESWISRCISLRQFGITQAVFEAALRLLSMPIAQMKSKAASKVEQARAKYRAPLPTAYQPSLLRLFPIISFGLRLRAPLRELILLRVTAGVYYDLVEYGKHLLDEASRRFENYSAKFIAAMMPRFDVRGSYKYRFRGNRIDTPDIMVKDREAVVVAVECKATKLTFAAQFADDPFAQAEREHGEIAKGVFQLWRYFSHARRGLITADIVRADAHGTVLTLDPWLLMSRERIEQVFARAEALALEDREITVEDRRKVVFCDISDLEHVLASSDEDAFLRTLLAAEQDNFTGWLFSNVRREAEGKATKRKNYPFELADVLPWWKNLQEKSGALLEVVRAARD